MIAPPTILRLQRHRHVWLLLVLVVFLMTSPLIDLTSRAGILLEIMFTITILSVVNAASRRPQDFTIALVLALPWLLSDWWGWILSESLFDVIADVLFVCLMYLAIYLILRELLSVERTDGNVLCGAVAVYLLIGISWAQVYVVIETLAPGSFAIRDSSSAAGWSEFVYFSLTTLTTLGYGDVTPLTNLAGVWSTLEAVSGSLYIAVLVARLVALVRK